MPAISFIGPDGKPNYGYVTQPGTYTAVVGPPLLPGADPTTALLKQILAEIRELRAALEKRF
jgi:hypothetical protein